MLGCRHSLLWHDKYFTFFSSRMHIFQHSCMCTLASRGIFPCTFSAFTFYVKIQRHQPCISKYISDPTLSLVQIINIRNCVLYGDIAATTICSNDVVINYYASSNKTRSLRMAGALFYRCLSATTYLSSCNVFI